MLKKTGLGKGLGALFNDNMIGDDDEVQLKEGEEIVHKIKTIDIEPNRNQPRKTFNGETIDELAESIKRYGIIQPIIVTKKDDYYEIIAGERRWRAAKQAGVDEIPCIIRENTEKKNKEIALIENIQREDLNAIEKARGFKELMDEYGLTQAQLSETLGISSSAIGNTLRLLNLDSRVSELVEQKKITEGHARQLLYFNNPKEQYEVAQEIIEKEMSVRGIEDKVKNLKMQPLIRRQQRKAAQSNPIVNDVENIFQNYFGTKVSLKAGATSGKIIIEYSSNEDLERILELVNKK